MNAQEPAPTLDAIERRVPFDCLTRAWRRFHDQRVEAMSNVALPPRHGGDIGLHGRVALALRDLRIAAREERRRRCLTGLQFGVARPWRFWAMSWTHSFVLPVWLVRSVTPSRRPAPGAPIHVPSRRTSLQRPFRSAARSLNAPFGRACRPAPATKAIRRRYRACCHKWNCAPTRLSRNRRAFAADRTPSPRNGPCRPNRPSALLET